MLISEVEYQGSLRTTCTHLKSSTEINTDAPIDNKGKGETFSPTDLVATGLAACMLTTMGIRGEEHNISFRAKCAVEKIMAAGPRRIEKVIVLLAVYSTELDDKQKQILTDAAINCPVAKSLHSDLIQEVYLEFIVID